MNKVVIITGAGSGIGLASARYLLKKGYTVYGIARSDYDISDFKMFKGDVCDNARMSEIFREIYESKGRIDALVNNAGYGVAGAAENISPEHVKKMLDVDVAAVVNLCALVIPYLKKSDGGRIINIGSVASLVPIPFQALYSAAKAAVENFSRALAVEVKAYNIKVTCILPGDTRTGFTDARVKFGGGEKSVGKMERDERNGKSPETVAKAVYKAIKKKHPPLRITVGAGYKILVFLSRVLPVRLVNFIIGKLYG